MRIAPLLIMIDTVSYIDRFNIGRPMQKRAPLHLTEPTQPERSRIFASALGFPASDVPTGMTQLDADAPLGLPIGLDLMAPPQSDAALAELALAIERAVPRPPAPLRYAIAVEFDITRAWPDQRRATVLFNDVRQPANQTTNKEDRARRIRGEAVGDLQSRHCKIVLRTQAMCDFNSGHELIDVSNCGAHLGNVSHDRQQANRSGIAGRIELVRKSWEVRQLGNASDVATPVSLNQCPCTGEIRVPPSHRRAQRRRYSRVGVGSCGSGAAGREGRCVQLMVGMQHQRHSEQRLPRYVEPEQSRQADMAWLVVPSTRSDRKCISQNTPGVWPRHPRRPCADISMQCRLSSQPGQQSDFELRWLITWLHVIGTVRYCSVRRAIPKQCRNCFEVGIAAQSNRVSTAIEKCTVLNRGDGGRQDGPAKIKRSQGNPVWSAATIGAFVQRRDLSSIERAAARGWIDDTPKSLATDVGVDTPNVAAAARASIKQPSAVVGRIASFIAWIISDVSP